MVLHNQGKKDKSKEGEGNTISPEDSEKHSWLHRRTADLVLAEYPDGQFPEDEWIRLYKMAKADWSQRKDGE